jgi:hypothetical protein
MSEENETVCSFCRNTNEDTTNVIDLESLSRNFVDLDNLSISDIEKIRDTFVNEQIMSDESRDEVTLSKEIVYCLVNEILTLYNRH